MESEKIEAGVSETLELGLKDKNMKDEDRYSYSFEVGREILITDPETSKKFQAKVVGVDHYTEITAAPNPVNLEEGLINSWVSYTLTSDNAPEKWGDRFWAVDSQKAQETGLPRISKLERAFYVVAQNTEKPEGFAFEALLSGRVDLSVVGEALHSTSDDGDIVARGILFTYRDKEKNKVWSEEVFTSENGTPERMVFEAIPGVVYE